jgi:pimeloyl-ACP methyl ester carboxylesterase
VRGWLVLAIRVPAPLLVYYGGNAEEISWQAAEPWPEGWSLALVNYRGYGQSGGKPSEEALFSDAEMVFDALAARADVDPARIVLVGRSLGSGVATYVASRRQIAGAILVSPYDSMIAIGQRHYPFLPVGLLLKHPFDSLARAPGVSVPLVAIVGERDGIIPPEHSRRLFEAWGGPKRWALIPGAGHNDLGPQREFWQPIREFLAERAR